MAIINALTDTWNNVATTFTAIKMTVTDTTSAAGSNLIDLLVGASSKFSVDKSGNMVIAGSIASSVGTLTSSVADGAAAVGFNFNTPSYTTAGALLARWQNNGVTKASLDKDGFLLAEKFSVTSAAYPFNWTEIRYGSDGWVLRSYAQDMLYVSGLKQCVLTQSSSFFGWASGATIEGVNADTRLYRGVAGRVDVCTADSTTFGDIKLRNLIVSSGLIATDAAAPTIASAGTIAPTTNIAFVSGTTTISTITAPSPISAGGGQITLIPTGLWSTNTAGNIALATTAVVSKALILTYDNTTGMWYPSY